MAGNGPSDDFNNQQTTKAAYGLEETAEPEHEGFQPSPWYRSPPLLIAWLLLVLILIALIVYGIGELIGGNEGTTPAPSSTTSTTAPTSTTETTSTSAPPASTDHRNDAAPDQQRSAAADPAATDLPANESADNEAPPAPANAAAGDTSTFLNRFDHPIGNGARASD